MNPANTAKAITIQSLGIVVSPKSVLALFLSTILSPAFIAIGGPTALFLEAMAGERLFAARAYLGVRIFLFSHNVTQSYRPSSLVCGA
jgi:hypothetical protein